MEAATVTFVGKYFGIGSAFAIGPVVSAFVGNLFERGFKGVAIGALSGIGMILVFRYLVLWVL